MTARPDAASSDGRRARAVFFGSGAFGLPALRALVEPPLRDIVDLVGVVSVPDRPVGRAGQPAAVPAAVAATELGIPVVKPARLRDPDSVASIAALGAELAILADYGRLVPGSLLTIPRRGFLNLHPSLLPSHRGATPVAGTILAGDDEAGVTLFEMDAGLDTGPIVAQTAWRLAGHETTPGLEAAAAEAAATLLAAELGPWLAG
ncbi:MAG TPA: methionyl-tRNA formyltransferase, partial [Candidatus Acidoferrales bacterium]|nr:methionyl-tRNA formyltransferase [Candidatus Acidoferrales bacterium]